MIDRRDPLTPLGKVRLVVSVLATFVNVHRSLRRHPLPRAVGALGAAPPAWWSALRPSRLSRVVHLTLHLGPWRPRCLVLALVLYRLLRAQGTEADLVIGLPIDAVDKDAHAWVEIDGVDIGPPPGKGVHEELARYR